MKTAHKINKKGKKDQLKSTHTHKQQIGQSQIKTKSTATKERKEKINT